MVYETSIIVIEVVLCELRQQACGREGCYTAPIGVSILATYGAYIELVVGRRLKVSNMETRRVFYYVDRISTIRQSKACSTEGNLEFRSDTCPAYICCASTGSYFHSTRSQAVRSTGYLYIVDPYIVGLLVKVRYQCDILTGSTLEIDCYILPVVICARRSRTYLC